MVLTTATEALGIAALIATLLGGIGFIVVWVRWERTRTRALATLAPQLGLSIVNSNLSSWLTSLGLSANLFSKGQGRSGRLKNAIEGIVGELHVALFDYSYNKPGNYTGDGPDVGIPVSQTVAAFTGAKKNLPAFVTRTGRLLQSSKNKVEIKGSPEFSERFVVFGTDVEAVQELFCPALTAFLLTTSLEGDLVIEGAGIWLVLYRDGRRVPLEQYQSFLDESSHLATGFFKNCAAREAVAAG